MSKKTKIIIISAVVFLFLVSLTLILVLQNKKRQLPLGAQLQNLTKQSVKQENNNPEEAKKTIEVINQAVKKQEFETSKAEELKNQ